MIFLTRQLTCAVLLSLVSLASAHAAPSYTVIPLGDDTTAARGINAAGLATGSAGGYGFIANGGNTHIGLEGEGYAINAGGQATGIANYGGQLRAFVSDGATSQNLGTLPGDDTSWGYGINAKGQVVGYSGVNGLSNRAFLYENGAMKNLGALGGADIVHGSGSVARAINDKGQITGHAATATNQAHAFIYNNGVMTDLGTLAGEYGLSDGHAVNASGHVAGTTNVFVDNGQSTASHAFLHDGTTMRDLDALGGANSYSVGRGINSFDDVVGHFQTIDVLTGSYGSARGFLYSHETQSFLDLNNIVAGLEAGWTISAAYAINDQGSIAAMETNADGYSRAVILKVSGAVPEPGSAVLGLVGLVTVAGLARGRRCQA